MKIGFLGNTNNYPFIIASQMQQLGCDVVLFVDAPPTDHLNRPEQYTHQVGYPYPNWINEKTSLRNSVHIHFPQFFERSVIKELNTCDAVILNDYGHRFKNFIKSSIPSISMFSGSDLEVMADYDNVTKMKLSHPALRFFPTVLKKLYAHFSVNQLRRGIRKAALVSYFPKGTTPNGDQLLDEIFDHQPFKRFAHFHVITDGYEYAALPDNPVFRIFSLTRFIWKKPLPPGTNEGENKGNDIMLRGIALFLEKHPVKLDIHFVEKGIHVQESKDLIATLGFTDMVTWHQQMPFKELQQHITKADLLFEQLGPHYISGGLYAMLQGRPVIGNARPEIFDALLKEPTPVCHARTPEDVAVWLEKLTGDKALLEDIGKRSRQYVLKHFDIMNETKYFKDFLSQVTGHA